MQGKEPRMRTQGDEEGAGVGCAQGQGAAKAKSKARLARFEELSDVEYQQRNVTNEIFIPVRQAASATK